MTQPLAQSQTIAKLSAQVISTILASEQSDVVKSAALAAWARCVGLPERLEMRTGASSVQVLQATNVDHRSSTSNE